MTHASYVPNFVPSYCENMRMRPPEYYHDLNWERDDSKVVAKLRDQLTIIGNSWSGYVETATGKLGIETIWER